MKQVGTMEYEGRICRAPMERGAYKLPVMVGCIYNKCRFCDLFKDLRFRLIPVEEVEAYIRRVYDAGGCPRKIFLGDGSAFALKTDYLCGILDLIHSYFPECGEINMNATVLSIHAKSDDELRVLAAKGVKHLYIGLESGLEDVLAFMDKGNTVEQLREVVRRINRYGMFFDAHIMTGSAGHERGMENAAATASVLAELNASSATNFSLFVHHETPLYDDMEQGLFAAASEYENLIEERELIRLLSEKLPCDGSRVMRYEGLHDYIAVHVWGTLPRDLDKMTGRLDKAIAEYRTKQDVKAVIGPGSTFEFPTTIDKSM